MVRVGGCGVGVVGGGGVSGGVGVVGFVGWCRYCWSYYWELVSFVLLVFAQGCSKTDPSNGTQRPWEERQKAVKMWHFELEIEI